jgi:hypothetical protein
MPCGECKGAVSVNAINAVVYRGVEMLAGCTVADDEGEDLNEIYLLSELW